MNILLIEDELLAMDELRHLMKPFEAGNDIVGFDNGEDALAYARRHAPDIVISDIRMPGMNGLEVVREILSVHPRAQIILLSGYNDFEYARTALKLGAREYLLKPATEAELNAAVGRATEAVRLEEAKSRQERQWSLSREFRGIASADEPDDRQAAGGHWLMIAVLLENWSSPYTWSHSGTSADAFLEQLRKDYHADAACFDMDGHLRIALLPVRGTERPEALRQTANRVHRYFQQSAGVVHTVFEIKRDGEQADEAYRRCLHRLESQARLGESTFMSPGAAASAQTFWDGARRLEQHIEAGEYGRIDLELGRIFEGLRREGTTIKQISMLLSDLLYALKYKRNRATGELEVAGEGEIYDYLKTCRTDETLREWFRERLAGLMAGIEHAIPQPKQLIPALLDYVQQRYGETVHLQDFASRHHVSVGYLSKLFKAETGSNFSDYLIRVRMNKAMELLDGGYKRIAEIGRLVGYEDPKFFSQTFKRHTGVTPQEYKRKES